MAREVRINIGAETSKYERAMRDVRLTTRQTTSFVSTAWLKAAGAFYTLIQARDLAKLGAQAEQEAASFASLAASYGASADHIIMKLKEASAGTVDTMTLVQKAGTAMMMGISPDKISKLMEIARATARMTGQSVTKSFEDISLAVGRQSRMILDNLGIIVKAGDANEQYARQLGKTASQLTETEKKQAFLNATVEAGEDLMRRLGEQTKSTAEMFQSFEAMIKNLKVWVGQGLVFLGKWVTIIFTEIGVIVNQTLEQIFLGWGHIMALIGQLPGGELLGFKALGDDLAALGEEFKGAREIGEEFIATLMKMEKAPKTLPRPGGQPPPDGAPPDDKDLAKRQMQDLDEMFKFYEQDRALLLSNLEEKMRMRADAAKEEERLQFEALDQMFAFYEQDRRTLQRHVEEKARIELEIEKQKNDAKIRMEKNQAAVVGNVQTVAAQFSSKTAKAIFGVTRAFEFGKATMAAFAAFNQALAMPPGPPVTIPMASWALAAGLSNAAAIAATTYGQLSSGGAAAAPGGGAARAVVPAPEPLSGVEAGDQVRQVNIYIQGDSINDEEYLERWAEKMSEMVEGSEIRLVASNSKFAEELT
jgi:hypothetical protein